MLTAVALITFAIFGFANAQTTQPQPGNTASKTDTRADFQSPALLREIDSILKRAAEQREAARLLPSGKGYVIPPIWRSTREDREASVRNLLDGALDIVTDAAILEMQAALRTHRDEIAKIRDRIAKLREQRIEAPPEGLLPSLIGQTQGAIDTTIADLESRISSHEKAIADSKAAIQASIRKAGIDLTDEQVELLLDSVLGSDLLRLVATYEVARIVDKRLATLLMQSKEDLKAARRYFAMHAALFALIVHAQDMLIEKIDTIYIPRLDGILAGITQARRTTNALLKAQNRRDQRRILEANLEAQDSSEKVAVFYRDYLIAQRKLLDDARQRALHDLAIADNTSETVEASFQLRALMDEARTSFEALKSLETPGFDQIFENKELKREFENLTQQLAPAS
jgi:hypothetical protein